MCKPQTETVNVLRKRMWRLERFLAIRDKGENVPDDILDRAVQMVAEAAAQYQRERKADSN